MLYAGFFRAEEQIDAEARESIFTIFIDAPEPGAIEALFQKHIVEAREKKTGALDRVTKIYLDTIVEITAPAMVAYRSYPEPPDPRVELCCDVVSGMGRAYGWSKDGKRVNPEKEGESETLEPFMVLRPTRTGGVKR